MTELLTCEAFKKLQQSAVEIERMAGVPPGIEAAGRRAAADDRIVVATDSPRKEDDGGTDAVHQRFETLD
jgi:hypothetical protein